MLPFTNEAIKPKISVIKKILFFKNRSQKTFENTNYDLI